jgi:hypothetical protein
MRTAREYNAIRRAEKATTPRHQITGLHMGKVVDTYDGDTCRVAIARPSWGPPAEPVVEYLSVRMLGYDAPEMKKDQLPYGREVKAVLASFVLDRVVVLDIPAPKRPDPYGRVLAHMYAFGRGTPYTPPPAPGPAAPRRFRSALACCSPGPAALRRIRRAMACCFPGAALRRTAAEAADSTDRDEPAASGVGEPAAFGVGEPAAKGVLVRGRAVVAPDTVDVPFDFVADEAGMALLLHVNAWMIENARVKEYDGSASRTGWTVVEIADGV